MELPVTVTFVKKELRAERMVEKNEVEVALVVEDVTAEKFVETRLVVVALVIDPFVLDKLVIVPDAEVRSEMVVVESVLTPVAVRLVTDVEASMELPETVMEDALVVDRLVVPVAVRLPVVRLDVLALDRLL